MDSEPVVTSIILSDGSIVERGTNKVSLIGCFNSLSLPKFPHDYQGFFATVGLTNLPPSGIKLALTIRIEVENTGHVLASVANQVELAVQIPSNAPPEAASEFRKLVIDVPFRFHEVKFLTRGIYSVVVLINNEPISKRNLLVQQHIPPGKPTK